MRLALFGGTFDPIHNAHLTVAREAADQFHLEQVWFIPAAHPPHKTAHTGATYEDRFRMTELACQADPRFIASRLEEGDGQELLRRHGGAGACARRAALLHHRRRRVRRNHHLAPLAGPAPADRIHRRDPARPSLCGASGRARAPAGHRGAARIFFRNKATSWLVARCPTELPAAVGRYISERGLYQSAPGTIEAQNRSSTSVNQVCNALVTQIGLPSKKGP